MDDVPLCYAFSGFPGIYDDHIPLTAADVELPLLPEYWTPLKYRASRNAVFYQAEELVDSREQVTLKKDRIWAEGKMLVWTPENLGDQLKFNIPIESEGEYVLFFTACKSPDSGCFRANIAKHAISFRNTDHNVDQSKY